MLAVSCDSRAAVDAMNKAAAKHGGTADINARQDYGFMYNRSLADPDGHIWEAMWMDRPRCRRATRSRAGAGQSAGHGSPLSQI